MMMFATSLRCVLFFAVVVVFCVFLCIRGDWD